MQFAPFSAKGLWLTEALFALPPPSFDEAYRAFYHENQVEWESMKLPINSKIRLQLLFLRNI